MENSIQQQILQRFRRQWSFLTISAYGVLLGIFVFLWRFLGFPTALRWLFPAAIFLGIWSLEIRRLLPENHRPGDKTLFVSLGWANIITISRGFIFVCVGGFLLLPSPAMQFTWIPGLLYTIGIIMDRFDGYLARRSGQVSVMGAQMDMRFDALGILIVILLGIKWGQLPWWYISVGMAFYLYDLGLRTWYHRKKPVYPLPVNPNRPVLAGMQMGFLAVSLWPIFSPAVLSTAALVFGLPLIVTFVRDWLFASGYLDPEAHWFREFTEFFGKLSKIYILPGIRIGILLLVLFQLVGTTMISDLREAASFLLERTISGMLIMVLPGILSSGLISGIMTRTCALGMMALSGASIMLFPEWILPKILLLGAGILVLYGPGRWSLIDLEERILYRKESPNNRSNTIASG